MLRPYFCHEPDPGKRLLLGVTPIKDWDPPSRAALAGAPSLHPHDVGWKLRLQSRALYPDRARTGCTSPAVGNVTPGSPPSLEPHSACCPWPWAHHVRALLSGVSAVFYLGCFDLI